MTTINIKITDKDKSVIKKKAHDADLTVSEFMRRCAMNKDIAHRVDIAYERDRLRTLNNASNNINQIAKWCNTYKSNADAIEVIKHLISIDRALHHVN